MEKIHLYSGKRKQPHSGINDDVTGLTSGTNKWWNPSVTPYKKSPSGDYIGGDIQVMFHFLADQPDKSRCHPDA